MKSIFKNDTNESRETINDTLENVRMLLGIDICSRIAEKGKIRKQAQESSFLGGKIKERMTVEKINAFFS